MLDPEDHVVRRVTPAILDVMAAAASEASWDHVAKGDCLETPEGLATEVFPARLVFPVSRVRLEHLVPREQCSQSAHSSRENKVTMATVDVVENRDWRERRDYLVVLAIRVNVESLDSAATSVILDSRVAMA